MQSKKRLAQMSRYSIYPSSNRNNIVMCSGKITKLYKLCINKDNMIVLKNAIDIIIGKQIIC